MNPTKNTMDYMSEMNRLSSRNNENDWFQFPVTPNTSQQSLNHLSLARSSSSTDTSPDSFPDMMVQHFPSEAFHRQNQRADQYDLQYQHDRVNQRYDTPINTSEMYDNFLPQHLYETPITVRQQRPIVGRKIIASEKQMSKNYDNVDFREDIACTPPQSADQKNQSMYYELFPENKEVEFKTPIKVSPNSYRASQMLNLSPRMSAYSGIIHSPGASSSSLNMSQRYPEMSSNRNISPGSSTSPCSQRYSTPTHFKEPIIGPSAFRPNIAPSKMCMFCRKNGETPLVYMTHTVREKVGDKSVVTCPILRSHICSTCGASGDDAHTITYCPVLRSTNNGRPLQSTTITLKNTRVKSNGRRRY